MDLKKSGIHLPPTAQVPERMLAPPAPTVLFLFLFPLFCDLCPPIPKAWMGSSVKMETQKLCSVSDPFPSHSVVMVIRMIWESRAAGPLCFLTTRSECSTDELCSLSFKGSSSGHRLTSGAAQMTGLCLLEPATCKKPEHSVCRWHPLLEKRPINSMRDGSGGQVFRGQR